MRSGCDAVVIGAGLAGTYMLHRPRGLGLAMRGYERGDGCPGLVCSDVTPGGTPER